MLETVGTCGYAEKLGKYGFSENLCSNKEQCEEWLNFCKKNNMIWLEDSYGTLVHKDFNKHFSRIGYRSDKSIEELEDARIRLGIINERYDVLVTVNHSNVIKSKVNGCYFVTSMPKYYSQWVEIENYPYQVFIIHPSLLEDYWLGETNLAYGNVTFDEMAEINKRIYEDIGIYRAFRWLHGDFKERD